MKNKEEIEGVSEWVKGEWKVVEFTSRRTSKSRFVGITMMHQEMDTPQGKVAREVPVPFDIVAKDVEEAFKYFDDGQQAKLKELQTKAEMPRIIQARGGNGGLKLR